MRNRIIMVLAALITVLVVYNLIQITIGIYSGDIPVRGAATMPGASTRQEAAILPGTLAI